MSEAFSFANEEGLLIRGDIDVPSAPGPAVVCVHGFKGFKDWGFWPETASRLCTAGYLVVRFNFSHSGIGEDLETFSEPALFESGTYSREIADLREILARLTQGLLPGVERLGSSRVGFLGHSRGSVASLAVAASDPSPARSVALWNPVSSVLWWNDQQRQRWREAGYWEVINSRTGQAFRVQTSLLDDALVNRDRIDPVNNARRLTVPLAVVVARDDESVPAESGLRLARGAPAGQASVVEIPDTGHTFGATHPFTTASPALERAIGSTIEHFEKTLRERE